MYINAKVPGHNFFPPHSFVPFDLPSLPPFLSFPVYLPWYLLNGK